MCGSESVGGGQNVPSNRIEDAGIFSEDVNVENFLRIAETKMLEL